jgi:hypothetical protein
MLSFGSPILETHPYAWMVNVSLYCEMYGSLCELEVDCFYGLVSFVKRTTIGLDHNSLQHDLEIARINTIVLSIVT